MQTIWLTDNGNIISTIGMLVIPLNKHEAHNPVVFLFGQVVQYK